MAAKRKTIEEKSTTAFDNKIEILQMKKPQGKQAGKILGSDASAVPELVKLLKEEAKVI